MRTDMKPRITFKEIIEEESEAMERSAEDQREQEVFSRQKIREYVRAKEAFLELPEVAKLDCIMASEYGSVWNDLPPEPKSNIFEIVSAAKGVNIYISPALRTIVENVIVENLAGEKERDCNA